MSQWSFSKVATVSVVVLMTYIAPVAYAAKNDCEWNPPARFDYEPTQPYRIIRKDQRTVQRICTKELKARGHKVQRDYRGCAFDDKIYVVIGGYKCATEAAIIRHEKGHLNNWSNNHEH